VRSEHLRLNMRETSSPACNVTNDPALFWCIVVPLGLPYMLIYPALKETVFILLARSEELLNSRPLSFRKPVDTLPVR
jgi:hypothetical protein